MPLVTTPFLIDPANFSRQSDSEINPMGPFLFGGKQYWVGTYNVNGAAGVRKAAVFSSSNNWASDTELDAANAPSPLVGIGSDPSATLAISFDSVAGVIGILYTLTTLVCHIIEFTCGPDTYGTPGTGFAAAPFGASLVNFFKRNDGTYVVLSTPAANYTYWTYAAGVWSGGTSLGAGHTPSAQLYDTATGICHLVFNGTPKYAQLSPSYVLSSTIDLPTSPVTIQDNFRATMTFFEAGIAIGWTSYLSALGQGWVAIAPDRSTPVFTGYNLFTGNNDGSDGASYMTVAVDESDRLNAFYVESDYNVDPIVDQLLWTIFNGTSWSAPVLVYDATANPPPDGQPDPIDQFIHTGEALDIGGNWIFATALETLDSAKDHCTGFMLVFPQATGLTLACPVNNTGVIGQPYTGMLIASGGTPPYTYAIIS